MNESKFCIECEEFRSSSYCNGERTNCMKTLFSIIKDLKEENKYLKNKLYIKEKSLQELIKKYEELHNGIVKFIYDGVLNGNIK